MAISNRRFNPESVLLNLVPETSLANLPAHLWHSIFEILEISVSSKPGQLFISEAKISSQ